MGTNKPFDYYGDLNFEGGISSVYLWDLDRGFVGLILIKKDGMGSKVKGFWDSIHIVKVKEKPPINNKSGSGTRTSETALPDRGIKIEL